MTLRSALWTLAYLLVVTLLLAVVAVAGLLGGPLIALLVAFLLGGLLLEGWIDYRTPTGRTASR
jgi:hypothetical protein